MSFDYFKAGLELRKQQKEATAQRKHRAFIKKKATKKRKSNHRRKRK